MHSCHPCTHITESLWRRLPSQTTHKQLPMGRIFACDTPNIIGNRRVLRTSALYSNHNRTNQSIHTHKMRAIIYYTSLSSAIKLKGSLAQLPWVESMVSCNWTKIGCLKYVLRRHTLKWSWINMMERHRKAYVCKLVVFYIQNLTHNNTQIKLPQQFEKPKERYWARRLRMTIRWVW